MSDKFTPMVKAADAQATIAALQARVQELEEITKVICGHCCEPMEIPSKAVLQSALTQCTSELARVRKKLVETSLYLQQERANRDSLAACVDRDVKTIKELRALIAALPKVEGQFEVGSGACYYVRALDGKSNPIVCGLMTEQAVAYAILALLKHRQGMEGYP